MGNRTQRAAGLAALLCGVLAILPATSAAQSSNTVGSPVCDGEGVTYNPGNGEDIAKIATRDGLQVIVMLCRDGCQDVHVGDYLEADGVKENEALFYADLVVSSSPGSRH